MQISRDWQSEFLLEFPSNIDWEKNSRLFYEERHEEKDVYNNWDGVWWHAIAWLGLHVAQWGIVEGVCEVSEEIREKICSRYLENQATYPSFRVEKSDNPRWRVLEVVPFPKAISKEEIESLLEPFHFKIVSFGYEYFWRTVEQV